MRRLVITGIPCPQDKWLDFLGPMKGKGDVQRVLPIREVFDNSESADPRELSRYVSAQIEKFRPDSIVAHDLGVPLTLISLLRLRKKHEQVEARVTLFNGAFRRFDIFKANHPFRVQLMSFARAVDEVRKNGGDVDPGLRMHMGLIRAMYRYVILYGLSEKVSELIGLEDLIVPAGKLTSGTPIQFIVSTNDPYIPLTSIRQLQKDFAMQRVVELEYGHFPYSLPRERILPLIEEFEQAGKPRRATTEKPAPRARKRTPAGSRRPTARPTPPELTL